MAKSNSGGAALATHSDVKGILGNLDAADMVAIMSLLPTIADIEEASVWLAGDADVFGAGEPIKGVAADIVTILTENEDEERGARRLTRARTRSNISGGNISPVIARRGRTCRMNPLTSPLLTDLYQLNMIQAYLDHGETKTAVFEFFVRKFPPRRGFLIAAGLQQVLDFLENLRFSPEEIDWLAHTHRFDKGLLDRLASFRFTGDVHAMPEGRVFFANEPILRVTAPMPQAQLVETRLINIVHFQTLIAAKAARMVLAAPGKLLVDFGLRRAHGAEAGLMAARASYIAGFAGTATMLAEEEFGIPIFRHDGSFLRRSLRYRKRRL